MPIKTEKTGRDAFNLQRREGKNLQRKGKKSDIQFPPRVRRGGSGLNLGVREKKLGDGSAHEKKN